MELTPGYISHVRDLDARLRELVKPILVLKHLNWTDAHEHFFLDAWRAGRPKLPEVAYCVPDWSESLVELDKFILQADGDDPLFGFFRNTAESYANAGRMLAALGTPAFIELSIRLYGRPDDVYETQSFTGVDAAEYLLKKTEPLSRGRFIAPALPDVPAAEFAERLQVAIDDYFLDDKVRVVVDNDLSSKAVTGMTKIRIRGTAMFSDLDFDQLFHHEALIHTATVINGRNQVNLKSLSLGAPRTTRTQEGLAVFAELVTGSIDISRLQRLALRIKALKVALEGADFIECFQLFLDAGQDEREAYKSTQRIFRGGDVCGKVVFTKDSAYLKGLMETHVFLNVALRDNRPELVERLFAGRLTLSDTITLSPLFDSDFVQRPRYVPPWARDTRRLAAALAYSSFMMNNVNLAAVSLDRFVSASDREAPVGSPS